MTPKEVVQLMYYNDEPHEKIMEFIDRVKPREAPPTFKVLQGDPHMDQSQIATTIKNSQANPAMDVPESYEQVGEQLRPTVRPMLKLGGQALGEFGAATASAPVPIPGSTATAMAVGGGLGYYGGNKLADYLLDENEANYQDDLLIGGGTSLVGNLLPKAIIKTAEYFPAPLNAALRKMWNATGGKVKVEPGRWGIDEMKPMLGQMGENAETKAFAGEVVNSAGDKGLKMVADRLDAQDAALREMLAQKVGGGNVDDLIHAARVAHESSRVKVATSKEVLDTIAHELNRLPEKDELSQSFIKILDEAKGVERKQLDEVFNGLADTEVKLKPIQDDLMGLIEEETKNYRKGFIPMKQISEVLSDEAETIPLSRLRLLISDAGKVSYGKGLKGDLVEKHIAQNIQDIYMNQLEKQLPDAIPEYKAAKAAWRNFKEKYYDGAVGRALDPYKADPSLVSMNKLYNPSNPEVADEILTALGPKEGTAQIDRIASVNMAEKAFNKDGTFDPTGYKNWLKSNKKILKRFKLYGKYKDMKGVIDRYTDAVANDKEFQKTVLAKVVGKNPKEIISSIFSSSDSGKATSELMLKLAWNPTARKGFKQALLDHIERKASSDITGRLSTEGLEKMMEKYDPVIMRAGFHPEELNAMKMVRERVKLLGGFNPKGHLAPSRMFEKIAVGERVPIGGGLSTKLWPFAEGISNAYNDRVNMGLLDLVMNPEKAAKMMKYYGIGKKLGEITPKSGLTMTIPMEVYNQHELQ